MQAKQVMKDFVRILSHSSVFIPHREGNKYRSEGFSSIAQGASVTISTLLVDLSNEGCKRVGIIQSRSSKLKPRMVLLSYEKRLDLYLSNTNVFDFKCTDDLD